jgi:YbbR domain-containing protein
VSRWIAKNLSLMLLSLVLAFFFWAVATEAEDPTSTRVFNAAIPVEVRGLPEGMTTYGAELARVRVEIQAPKSVWDRLQADDIDAYVDLSSGQTGTYHVPVVAVIGLEPSTIASITPKEIELTVEAIAEKEVDVDIRVHGNPAMGFIARNAELAPQSVRIRGPESKVSQVVGALVVVDITDRQNDLRSDYEPMPIDINEVEVSLVEIVPRSVTVNVPVSQWLDTRDIPVNPNLVGQPAPGYRIADLEIDPQILTVYGRADVLASTTTLQTEPIDYDGITQTLRATVPLRLPTGLFVFSAQSSVTVTLTVEAIRSGLTLEVTPTIRGLGPDLTATVGLDTVIVILSGPLAAMDTLDPAMVQVVLDVSGLPPGDYTLPPVIDISDGFVIDNITPQAVPVRIVVYVAPTATPDTQPSSVDSSPT